MVTAILFGLYSAGVAIAISLIEYFTGMDKTSTANWLGYLSLPFLMLFLWMAMKERKQDDYGGMISYGQCVGTGALVGLFAGIVTAIFMYVYFTAINPGMVDIIVQKQEAAMRAQQMDQQKMHDAMAMARQWIVPGTVLAVLFFDVLFAVIFSLIIGIFVRTKEEDSMVKAV